MRMLTLMLWLTLPSVYLFAASAEPNLSLVSRCEAVMTAVADGAELEAHISARFLHDSENDPVHIQSLGKPAELDNYSRTAVLVPGGTHREELGDYSNIALLAQFSRDAEGNLRTIVKVNSRLDPRDAHRLEPKQAEMTDNDVTLFRGDYGLKQDIMARIEAIQEIMRKGGYPGAITYIRAVPERSQDYFRRDKLHDSLEMLFPKSDPVLIDPHRFFNGSPSDADFNPSAMSKAYEAFMGLLDSARDPSRPIRLWYTEAEEPYFVGEGPAVGFKLVHVYTIEFYSKDGMTFVYHFSGATNRRSDE